MAHILVANHRSFAVGTPHKSLQNILGLLQVGELAQAVVIRCPPLIGDLLDLFKGFLVDNRFMGVADDDPVGLVHISLPLSLVEGLLFAPLNHVTYVNGMGQYAF